jgi:hypothetical protein
VVQAQHIEIPPKEKDVLQSQEIESRSIDDEQKKEESVRTSYLRI